MTIPEIEKIIVIIADLDPDQVLVCNYNFV